LPRDAAIASWENHLSLDRSTRQEIFRIITIITTLKMRERERKSCYGILIIIYKGMSASDGKLLKKIKLTNI
jgi:hypothetical protein